MSQQIRRNKSLTALGILIAFALVAGALAVYFVRAGAAPSSAADARINGWVSQLSEERLSPARHQAQQNLEKAGPAAVPALVTALHSQNATLRRNAAEMLGFIGAPESADALRGALQNDSVPAVRSRAAWALGELNDVRVLRDLEQASVLDRNLLVRQAAQGSIVALRGRLANAAGKNERLVRAVAVAPNRPNIVYLAEAQEISVSRDSGKTWSVAQGTTPSRVTSLAVHPTNPNIIYAGTEAMGLYKSDDGGNTWSALNEGLGLQPGLVLSITAISIDPKDPSRVYVAKGAYVGTSNVQLLPMGVMLSIDGGATWQSVKVPASNEAVTRLLLSGDKLYAVAGDRVVSTTI